MLRPEYTSYPKVRPPQSYLFCFVRSHAAHRCWHSNFNHLNSFHQQKCNFRRRINQILNHLDIQIASMRYAK